MHETRWGVCVSATVGGHLFGALSIRVIAPHLPTSVGAAEGHHRARVRMGGADREDGADEVYANGIALDVVRGWLGASASDLDWDTFDDVDDVDATRARPERLGLGAKFLSHARAQQLGNVARKLGGAIARSAKRRREDGDSDSESEEAATASAGQERRWDGQEEGAANGRSEDRTRARRDHPRTRVTANLRQRRGRTRRGVHQRRRAEQETRATRGVGSHQGRQVRRQRPGRGDQQKGSEKGGEAAPRSGSSRGARRQVRGLELARDEQRQHR